MLYYWTWIHKNRSSRDAHKWCEGSPSQDKKCPGMTSGLLHKEQSLKVTVKHGRNFDKKGASLFFQILCMNQNK